MYLTSNQLTSNWSHKKCFLKYVVEEPAVVHKKETGEGAAAVQVKGTV